MEHDLTADGGRFLVVTREQDARTKPAVVVLDWFEELNARMKGLTRAPGPHGRRAS